MAGPGEAGDRRLLYSSPWTFQPNPFLEILYSRAAQHGFKIVGDHPYRDMLRPLNAVHYHLPHTVCSPPLLAIANVFFILLCKLRRIPLVYTVHNLQPHESHGRFYRLIVRLLFSFADVIMYHARFVGDHLVSEGIEGPRVTRKYIPHPTYNGSIPEEATADVRERHSIPEGAKILLCFGLIRRYKGIEEIIDAFKQVLRSRQDVFLIVLGKAFDEEYLDELRRKSDSENIIIEEELLEDEHLFSFFSQAWGTVYAQRDITTSGSAMMSVTFEVPMVYPDVAHFRDLGRVGVPFGEREGLAEAILRFVELPEEEVASFKERLRELVEAWNYKRISDQYFDFLESLQRT